MHLHRHLPLWSVALLLSLGSMASAQSCRHARATPQNAKQPIVVSTSPVDIAQTNTSRCSLFIQNLSPNPIMCSDVDIDGPPTLTTGTPLAGGEKLALGFEGQGRWQCIRTGGADGLVAVTEGRP